MNPFLLVLLSRMTPTVPTLWILADGTWNDAGVWDDDATWNDGDLMIFTADRTDVTADDTTLTADAT